MIEVIHFHFVKWLNWPNSIQHVIYFWKIRRWVEVSLILTSDIHNVISSKWLKLTTNATKIAEIGLFLNQLSQNKISSLSETQFKWLNTHYSQVFRQRKNRSLSVKCRKKLSSELICIFNVRRRNTHFWLWKKSVSMRLLFYFQN